MRRTVDFEEAYTQMQFLRVLSHCVVHAEPLQTAVHDDSGDESDCLRL